MTRKFCSDRVEADETAFHGCFLGRMDDVRVDENGILFFDETCNEDAEPISQIGLDELLIAEVQKYPPLYDHRLEIDQRSRPKRDSCWQKIFVSLRGQIPLKDSPKKWRNQRDKYIKAKKEDKKYTPSGSATQNKKPPAYRNYALMHFLDDIMKNKDTTCNLELPLASEQAMEDSNQYDSSDVDLSSPSTSVSSASSLIAKKLQSKRRRRASSNIEEALSESIRQPIQMPPPPTPPPHHQ